MVRIERVNQIQAKFKHFNFVAERQTTSQPANLKQLHVPRPNFFLEES
jgi:hypothetical protein